MFFSRQVRNQDWLSRQRRNNAALEQVRSRSGMLKTLPSTWCILPILSQFYAAFISWILLRIDVMKFIRRLNKT